MASISIRLSDAELEVLDKVAKENGVSRSEQIRQGLAKYLELCKKVKEGNFVVTLPRVEPQELYIGLRDIQEIKKHLKQEHGDSPIIPMLDAIFNAVQFDTALKIIEEQPDELVSFDFNNGEEEIDLYEEAVEAQKQGLIDKKIKLRR
ncbi:MAG: CopG family transcriptional regulator [Niameybacter sp.]